jgi:hypothetical protein
MLRIFGRHAKASLDLARSRASRRSHEQAAPAPNAPSEARAVRDRRLAELSKYLDAYMRSPSFLTTLRSGLMIMVSIRLLYRLHASTPSRATDNGKAP